MKAKILHLTLHRKWFDEVRSGEKKEEYRRTTKYWRSRLLNKQYDEIRFVNGYGRNRPFMRVEYLGIREWSPADIIFVIHLGKILEVGNV